MGSEKAQLRSSPRTSCPGTSTLESRTRTDRGALRYLHCYPTPQVSASMQAAGHGEDLPLPASRGLRAALGTAAGTAARCQRPWPSEPAWALCARAKGSAHPGPHSLSSSTAGLPLSSSSAAPRLQGQSRGPGSSPPALAESPPPARGCSAGRDSAPPLEEEPRTRLSSSLGAEGRGDPASQRSSSQGWPPAVPAGFPHSLSYSLGRLPAQAACPTLPPERGGLSTCSVSARTDGARALEALQQQCWSSPAPFFIPRLTFLRQTYWLAQLPVGFGFHLPHVVTI